MRNLQVIAFALVLLSLGCCGHSAVESPTVASLQPSPHSTEDPR